MSVSQRRMPRGLYALICLGCMLCIGVSYSWSIFATYISAELTQYSSAQISLTYTINLIMFSLGSIIGGRLSSRFDGKKLAFVGPAIFSVGFFLTSRTTGIIPLYISYGVFCGIAAGILYNFMMGIISRTFSSRVGLLSGILLTGPAAGSAVLNAFILQTAGGSVTGWRTTFTLLSIFYGTVILILALLVRFPVEPANAVGTGEAPKVQTMSEMPPSKMLRRHSFWFYFVWAMLVGACSSAVVSQASQILLNTSPNVLPATMSLSVSSIVFINALARIIFGQMFDKSGVKRTLLTITTIYLSAFIMLLLATYQSSFLFTIAGFVLVGLAQGGAITGNSIFILTYYGVENYPSNFSIINLAGLASAFGSVLTASIFDLTASYFPVMLVLLCMVSVSAALVCFVKKP